MRIPVTGRWTVVTAFPLVLSMAVLTHPLHAVSGRTFGTAGKEERVLKAGVEAELFRHTGKGFLTHMWFGGDFKNYGLTRIRVYVDGEREASIDMELMMGHGIGFQDEGAPWGVERIGKTGQPSGIYNTYRIPFGTSVRVTAQRVKGDEEVPPFWWIIRGVENVPLEVGGVRLPDDARLRLYKVVNRKTKPLEEFAMCDTAKSGMLYMVTIAGKSSAFCFMESCVRAYIGDAKSPLLLSSGMEDYFLGTYDFNKGKYYTPVAGVTHLVPDAEFSAYRFHETDPVFFNNGLRLTLRDGEESHGKVFGCNPRDTVFTTYVWVYQWPQSE
jgi:D-arabinan exo alpha-(1,3)/(1,5)-arabinofuranosidase (non-reducing end)